MGKSKLYVEGKDDEHVIGHLLLRHRIDPVAIPEMTGSAGVDKLLEGMKTAIRVGRGTSVGLVLDANSSAATRWQSIRDRLGEVGVQIPLRLPSDGFVGESTTYRTRVGIWMMPDNVGPGSLEDFLLSLIAESDSLIDHATKATRAAREEYAALFSDSLASKATVHCWLAWQEEPGLRYGTAIKARYFRHDAAAAESFVAWFRRLYGINS